MVKTFVCCFVVLSCCGAGDVFHTVFLVSLYSFVRWKPIFLKIWVSFLLLWQHTWGRQWKKLRNAKAWSRWEFQSRLGRLPGRAWGKGLVISQWPRSRSTKKGCWPQQSLQSHTINPFPQVRPPSHPTAPQADAQVFSKWYLWPKWGTP